MVRTTHCLFSYFLFATCCQTYDVFNLPCVQYIFSASSSVLIVLVSIKEFYHPFQSSVLHNFTFQLYYFCSLFIPRVQLVSSSCTAAAVQFSKQIPRPPRYTHTHTHHLRRVFSVCEFSAKSVSISSSSSELLISR